MTEPSKQDNQEPSMEEILASIRRIISDDGQEQAGQGGGTAPDGSAGASASAAAPPKAPTPLRPNQIELSAPQAPEPDEDPEEDEEPLVLTQAVQEDGTVIDLAAQRAASQAARAAPEPEPEMEADPEPELEAAVAPDPVELELYEDEQTDSSDDADTDNELHALDEPAGEDEDMSDSEASRNERLVSEATEAATLAALSELSRDDRAVGTEPLPGGDRTLEQVVRDAISEHLRTWLDANLPTLVERIVREEVRRMARRAEDD